MTWLIDKSALARLGVAAERDEWLRRIERGVVSITTPTLLEVGFSATSAADWRDRVKGVPIALMPRVTMVPQIEDRALEVQQELASRGQHRAPSIPDLLIAAAAEFAGLTVLHLDKDYELIAEVTGQPTERLAIT